MPLSRLENFLINTDGNILYVNPSDLDATDSFDNKGNSLTRPFVSIQRALLEAARFAYQSGPNNDKYDKTTILIYPGTHYIDNRPGYYIDTLSGSARYQEVTNSGTQVVSNPQLELNSGTVFDLNNSTNVLYKLNSVDGGVIIPKGTSIVGMDLRKTKVKPLFVPDPTDSGMSRSAIFRVTGGCYFWQFSIFDADSGVFYNKNYAQKTAPEFSHHKLTCFEYADGVNVKDLTGLTDLDMYYYKLMNAYGSNTGNRNITPNYPASTDFEPNSPEFKIVGDLSESSIAITKVTSNNLVASVDVDAAHGLSVDDAVRISGISSGWYSGPKVITGITSERKFTFTLPGIPNETSITPTINDNAKVIIDSDNVTGASPYIFNCSLRSVYGMCGLHADGSKATGFKSMVVAQFTGIGLQKDDNAFRIYNTATSSYNNTTQADSSLVPLAQNQDAVYDPDYGSYHIKSSNDAFIQAVSVFAIGFSNHFVAEDGADQSITNSNSNFGAKSLVSTGFRKSAFPRDDTGYITHIVPPKDLEESTQNVVWRSLDPVKTDQVGIASHLYILGATDKENPPSNIVNGYRVGAKIDETLYLTATVGGVSATYSAPILMQKSTAGDGPISEKRYTATSIDTATNILTLGNHEFISGESVRVYSDTGIVPDGLVSEEIYYTVRHSATEIKLAKTFNAATAQTPETINIRNTNGLPLTIISRVTDKLPGDIGHPIQWDATNSNWYILTSFTGNSNTIFGILDSNPTEISDNNSAAYVQRKSENRDLGDRIYKLRYVIPKDYTGAKIAKAPSKNYVLQESSTVNIDDHGDALTSSSNIAMINKNRNPRIIAGISLNGTTATVTSEKAHKLSIGDRVLVNKVTSTGNPAGIGNSGYNGYFSVVDIPAPNEFMYTVSGTPGTFNNTISTRDSNLPEFSRNEYDTSYTIQEVDTVQEYISNEQDGIYYLTCLIGNISPTKEPFTGRKFKQDLNRLYPTVDVDNPNTDPNSTISAADNKLIGKVVVNDSLNSVTKESIVEYLKDNRIGFGLTGATSDQTSPVSGIVTLTSERNHNLNQILKIHPTVAGTGYNGGSAGIVYNVSLVDQADSKIEDATANITVNGSGQITAAQIVNRGSAAGLGNTLAVTGGTSGVVQVNAYHNVNNEKVIQVVGVGAASNRTDSAYNGLYKIHSTPSANSVRYTVIDNSNTNVNPGIYTSSASTGMFILGEAAVAITNSTSVGLGTTASVAGIATLTTSTAHGLSVGNKIKLAGVTGFAATIYNGDFVVQGVSATNSFTIDVPLGITSTSGWSSVELYKYPLTSYGQDSSLQTEKISGSLIPLGSTQKTTLTNTLAVNASGDSINVASTVGITSIGEYVQIDNEILRIKKCVSSTQIDTIRGVLGSRAAEHAAGSIIRKINVVPSEVRRFSSIRASGHTFEYLGYGPGNYSTSLPQLQKRTITAEEENLALSNEEKGGVVFFSGMNDRGDFFSGERAQPQENFLGDDDADGTAIFDDVYIRNTLRVGGGPNRNLPSEFRGPVNFTNKITSTAGKTGESNSGIEAIKLLLKGNPTVNPSLQIGSDNAPAFIVNENTQNVGIHTINPNSDIELDVNGTIRANAYDNFKLTDLPIGVVEEETFARNRVLKVKDDGTGYELVDPHRLDSFALRSYGISNDPKVYVGISSVVDSKLQVSGIGTDKFFIGERVKVFGVDPSGTTNSIPTATGTVTRQGSATVDTLYYYWVVQFNIQTGRTGERADVTFSGGTAGMGNVSVANMNSTDHNVLSLTRQNSDHGLLIYRYDEASNVATPTRSIEGSRLIAVLGNKELGTTNGPTIWKDYGNYNKTAWSTKGDKNEYIGFSTMYNAGDQIHFPVSGIANGKRRGWVMESVVAIGNSNIQLSGNHLNNTTVGFGTTALVKVVHDNTNAFKTAIDTNVATGGNYLEIPSGTYYAQEVIIPTGFTLRGNGKNTKLKHQFYANDQYDSASGDADKNEINGFADGNFVGIGTTNPKDVSIVDLTIDGNGLNQVNFNEPDTSFSVNNYLVYLGDSSTSIDFKNVEVRNSSAGGIYCRNSNRLSIENSSVVDGCVTDEVAYQPIDAQGSTSLRITDSIFENYPGPVDVSVTSVVSVGSNIIRNCGTGLRTYATGKITTTDNIILGPSDEWIPSPDIYDSDWSSVNINVDRSEKFVSPLYLYIEEGNPKDLSAVDVSASGIGLMENVGGGTTEFLGPIDQSLLFDGPTNASLTDGFAPEDGYLRFELTNTKTSLLNTTSAYGYKIIGTEYRDKPVGYSTYVGIGTGKWQSVGAGQTMYTVHLQDATQYAGISTGNVVKLVGHYSNPSLHPYEFTVGRKYIQSGDRKLELWPVTPFSLTSTNVGGTRSGYISIRNIFTIAKGRVGVT